MKKLIAAMSLAAFLGMSLSAVADEAPAAGGSSSAASAPAKPAKKTHKKKKSHKEKEGRRCHHGPCRRWRHQVSIF